jgi:hypothetical protein
VEQERYFAASARLRAPAGVTTVDFIRDSPFVLVSDIADWRIIHRKQGSLNSQRFKVRNELFVENGKALADP